MKPHDLTGQRFGRLVITGHAGHHTFPSGQKRHRWHCICDCGAGVEVFISDLRSGHTTSCGCFMREVAVKNGQITTHGGHGTREYHSWRSMKHRCYNRQSKDYPNWGGRGIRVCAEWVISFEAFYADMGPRPRGTTLDRKNNNGNYNPSNCRWATAVEQNSNRRR